MPIIMSIACCYVEGGVALLKYSYNVTPLAVTMMQMKTLEMRYFCGERHIHHDEDDAAGVDVVRCWRKLGNYIDRGLLRVLSKRKRSAMIC